MSAPGDTMTQSEMAAQFGHRLHGLELVVLLEHDGEGMWQRDGDVWRRLQGPEDV